MSNSLTVNRILELLFIFVAGLGLVVTVHYILGSNYAVLGGGVYAMIATGVISYIFSIPSKLTKREKFKQYFGFHPKLLTNQVFQTQAICKLLFLNKHVFDTQQRVRAPLTRGQLIDKMYTWPKDNQTKRANEQQEYEQTLGEYMSHMELLHYYHPEFAKTIPHWTTLHHFFNHRFTKQQTDSGYSDISFVHEVNQFLLNKNN